MLNKEAAINFINKFHGKKFNFIEDDECRVALLKDAYIEAGLNKKLSKEFLETQEFLFLDELG
jgi:hypothetical protein